MVSGHQDLRSIIGQTGIGEEDRFVAVVMVNGLRHIAIGLNVE
jgi:hypothetical protein